MHYETLERFRRNLLGRRISLLERRRRALAENTSCSPNESLTGRMPPPR